MGEHTNSASTKVKNDAASLIAAAAGSTVAAAAVAATGQLQHLQQQQQASTSGSAGLTPSTVAAAKDARELLEIRNLLWGPAIRLDVFRRWSQGGWWTTHIGGRMQISYIHTCCYLLVFKIFVRVHMHVFVHT